MELFLDFCLILASFSLAASSFASSSSLERKANQACFLEQLVIFVYGSIVRSYDYVPVIVTSFIRLVLK